MHHKHRRQPAINPTQRRIASALLDWFFANARDLPWRRTRDPYAIWVSEIMLQQTQVKTVIPYWNRWMRELPTIRAVANANPDKIHKLWEGLGYYTRARNLHRAAKQIVEKRGGKFPDNFDDVLALPGIGRYTAGAICSIAFNQPAPILDGNVIRVLTRLFGIGENPREKKTNALLWRLAEELVAYAAFLPSHGRRRRKESSSILLSSQRLLTSSPTCSHFNQSLMELGALVCTPRNPQCPVCPLKKLCVAFRKDRVETLPNLSRRTPATARHFLAFVVERNGCFLVRQRPAGVVNAHLWEFPNIESNGADYEGAFNSIFGIRPPALESLCTVKHSITRYRITLEVWRAIFKRRSSAAPDIFGARRARPSENSEVWRTLAKMNSLAFTGAHRKILSRLTSNRRYT